MREFHFTQRHGNDNWRDKSQRPCSSGNVEGPPPASNVLSGTASVSEEDCSAGTISYVYGSTHKSKLPTKAGAQNLRLKRHMLVPAYQLLAFDLTYTDTVI